MIVCFPANCGTISCRNSDTLVLIVTVRIAPYTENKVDLFEIDLALAKSGVPAQVVLYPIMGSMAELIKNYLFHSLHTYS